MWLSGRKQLLTILVFCAHLAGWAQQKDSTGNLSGVIKSLNEPLVNAQVRLEGTQFSSHSDSLGKFLIRSIPVGKYQAIISCLGCKPQTKTVIINSLRTTILNVELDSSLFYLKVVEITSEPINEFGISHMKAVENDAIYAAKKSEVITMDNVIANTATNNSRQVYSKVPGLNIFENDGAGIQLGIGGRGLNPNRVSNFNTRQNGYDISADALGYPESYYTPPTEAIDRIEIVRGAASLQYGPQFGGFINFKLKKGNPDKPVEVITRNTAGSFGLLNSITSVGGTTKNKKLSYYTFYQRKQGDGWRPNSGFAVNTAHASLVLKPIDKLSITTEYTYMNYLAQQAGGLTDKQFEQDPQQSNRDRNWFMVHWNLAAVMAEYKLNSSWRFNTRFFGLMANRSALGVLTAINRADPMQERDLWTDDFKNWGNETRALYTYIVKNLPSTLVLGGRYYKGNTHRKQGLANDKSSGTKEDFIFIDTDSSAYSDYRFPSQNISFFAENLLQLSNKLSVIPGIRFENISTHANGYYNHIERNLPGDIIYKAEVEEYKSSARSFVLMGLGLSYKLNSSIELYANISQNYRGINFNDIRVVNPNLRVDPLLKDERGYTADAGIRGSVSNIFTYDVSVFTVYYNDRIGSVLKVDSNTFNTYRYRTNIADSRNNGLETFFELDLFKLIFGKEAKTTVAVFNNFSYIQAHYLNSKTPGIDGNKVEMVPEVILKSGLTYKYKSFGITYQYSYTSNQYTDASNAKLTSNAVNGLIPAYTIMDLSANYTYKFLGISAGINNLTNVMYFTRRADGYPGPGIIPSDARSFYVSLMVKI